MSKQLRLPKYILACILLLMVGFTSEAHGVSLSVHQDNFTANGWLKVDLTADDFLGQQALSFDIDLDYDSSLVVPKTVTLGAALQSRWWLAHNAFTDNGGGHLYLALFDISGNSSISTQTVIASVYFEIPAGTKESTSALKLSGLLRVNQAGPNFVPAPLVLVLHPENSGSSSSSNSSDGSPRDNGSSSSSAFSDCSDGIDNDLDGLVDDLDPGCQESGGQSEGELDGPECSDGIDNDKNGLSDLFDYYCDGPTDPMEGDDFSDLDCRVVDFHEARKTLRASLLKLNTDVEDAKAESSSSARSSRTLRSPLAKFAKALTGVLREVDPEHGRIGKSALVCPAREKSCRVRLTSVPMNKIRVSINKLKDAFSLLYRKLPNNSAQAKRSRKLFQGHVKKVQTSYGRFYRFVPKKVSVCKRH